MASDFYLMLGLRKDLAFIPGAFLPTMARTRAGFYIGSEPVEVVDRADPKEALLRTMVRGRPVIPTPPRDMFPKSVSLQHAKVRSLSAFEKDAKSWSFSRNKKGYFIVPHRSLGRGRAVENTEQQATNIPARTSGRLFIDW